MSLNAPEIDLVLSEITLVGGHVQKALQPDFKNLYLSIYTPPRAWWLRICVQHPRVRLHRSRPPHTKRSHQRFEEFLHANITGALIESVEHVFSDRIIRLSLRRSDARTFVYFRLWGTRANVVVTTADGEILDAMLRKPNEGLVTGGRFVPEEPTRRGDQRTIRERDTRVSFNEQIDREYAAAEAEEERERLVATCRRALTKEISRLDARRAEIEHGRSGADSADQFRRFGSLILSNIYRIRPGDDHVDVEDYEDGSRTVRIPLDPARTASENAEQFFERAKRARSSREFLDERAGNLDLRIATARSRLEMVESMDITDLRELAAHLRTSSRASRESSGDGLRFSSGGFEIIVGRNASENDRLLRRAVRGNDWWLHTRDYPGGYVFIRNRPGKSVPLDVLLDAGTLALFFSKAKASGRADLYYTQVKYLRRPREGPTGLVLPTQEKNLSVSLDPDRLARLGIGSDL
jgi:predicted ribosome quality control (RQC) complex YloA/Tae2 family protein